MKGQTKKQSDIAPTPLPGVMRINPHMVMSEVNGQDKLIKLCSNESALGPSPRALSSANKALEHAHHYFEYGMFELQQAIADCFDLDPDSVACGNGSDDLIARLVRSFIRPGDELIRSANGYAKYINYAHAAGAVSISAQDNNFRADVQSILEAVTDHTRMIMLANPDNPTGSMLSKDEVQYLHDSIPNNVLLLLDSAYAEYVDNPDYETPVNLIEKNENVVMTRTFSKLFGLAGLRLGWLYGPPVVVDAVKRIGLTFPVNNVAAAAGITATKDRDYMEHVKSYNKEWRDWLFKKLESFSLEPYPSETNFILVKFPSHDKSAERAYKYLYNQGYITRLFPQKAFSNHMRITIGLEDDMKMLARHLEEFLNN